MYKRCFLSVFILLSFHGFAQVDSKNDSLTIEKVWYVSTSIGVQMSGIKNEDFISSNYSPVVRVSLGRWLNQSLAIKIGYQGRYFRAIADDIKHYYNFYYGEVVFDVKNILFKKKKKRIHQLLFHIGPGYFYNSEYDRANVHGTLGASNIFPITKNVKLNFDVSAIVGWDIYQGDNDILPSISIGAVYSF